MSKPLCPHCDAVLPIAGAICRECERCEHGNRLNPPCEVCEPFTFSRWLAKRDA